jgi:hypothetical protein
LKPSLPPCEICTGHSCKELRCVEDREGRVTNARSVAVDGRIGGHDPPQFSGGLPGRYGHRLLRTCCPAAPDPRDHRLNWFALHGVTVTRVLTDNGVGYRSRLFGAALADTGVHHQRTRPYRPQTNGKVERCKPDPARGVGLSAAVPVQRRPRPCLAWLGPPVQHAPRPHRLRRPATHQPHQQPPWLLHLGSEPSAISEPKFERGVMAVRVAVHQPSPDRTQAV